jgi:hypothetical protein
MKLIRDNICGLFLFLPIITFAQFTVTGIVYDAEKNPIPGVNIMHKGEPQTVTDIDGKFTIECESKNSILVINTIGYVSLEIQVNGRNYIEIILEESEEGELIDWGCVFYYRFTQVGLSSGLNYTPIGFKIQNLTPYLWRFNLHLATNFEWRKGNQNNQYINLSFRKTELLRIKKAQMSVFGEYKSFDNSGFLINEWNIAPEINFNRFRFSTGFSIQNIQNTEEKSQRKGFYLGIYKFFRGDFGLDFNTQYLEGAYQFDIKLQKYFSKPKLTFGVAYERINRFDEISTFLMYRFDY